MYLCPLNGVVNYQQSNYMEDYEKKSSKRGEVRKCPQCGEIVYSYMVECPSCHFVFDDAEANLSSLILAEKLEGLEYDEDKCQAIETFPIPNSKTDLLEFLTSLKPRVKKVDNPLSEAYFVKYQECIEKAKVSFPNDKELQTFVREYEALAMDVEKRKRNMWVKDHLKQLVIAVCIILALIVAGITIFVLRDTVRNSKDLCVKAVNEAVTKGDIKKARNLIFHYEKAKDDVMEGIVSLLTYYLDEDKFEDAQSLVEFYGHGPYARQLNRGLYNWLVYNGRYSEAEPYVNSEERPTNQEYFDYLKDCVMQMGGKGELDRAEDFIQEKSKWFVKDNPTGFYSRPKVLERLHKVMSNFQ